MASKMHSFVVPKSRRPRFNLKLQIHDLNNVPLVSGLAYVKWHIRDSPLAESRGRTSKIPIKEHRVSWGYLKELVIKMTVGRGGLLQPVYLDLEIIQEYSGRERIVLGTLELNIAEYVGRDRENRRYLMQASKINSTVQISTELKQISGDANFKVPDLRPAQVFSGIAGIAMGEQLQLDAETTSTQAAATYGTDISAITAHSRERDRIQDIYRKSLAASWQLQTSELNAVDCIEDIFIGGNGWADQDRHRQSTSTENTSHSSPTVDVESEASAHSPDFRASGYRSPSQKFSSWPPPGSDHPYKRSRSFHSDRQLVDLAVANSSALRSGSISVSRANAPRNGLLGGRPTPTSRALSIVDQLTPGIPAISEGLGHERITLGAPVSHHWHVAEIAEEDLREDFISWSL
ncbi:hypothetical protein DRE_01394 [Drechslerella stenobrocha 248]|uniref:C2 NT-type domain-containing protein n=1 Tax=Drechslerella stenobrocha 248 TaxID=1043628 RepID=W7HVH5_9PEZI|nr:hypothetical protein DRE_01394 [Drechslerella stenobrocha 248]